MGCPERHRRMAETTPGLPLAGPRSDLRPHGMGDQRGISPPPQRRDPLVPGGEPQHKFFLLPRPSFPTCSLKWEAVEPDVLCIVGLLPRGGPGAQGEQIESNIF